MSHHEDESCKVKACEIGARMDEEEENMMKRRKIVTLPPLCPKDSRLENAMDYCSS